MANNDNFKKMYHDGAQVGIMALTESGTQTPANIESWTLDDYGKPISIVIKDGVTEIPYYFQYYNDNLREVTIPNSVTKIGEYGFAYCMPIGGFNINIPSGLTNCGTYVFNYSNIASDLTIPSASFSTGSTASGASANWAYGFNYTKLSGNTITIEDGVETIPRYFARGVENGTIIVPSSVTYLSSGCFGSSFKNTTRIIKFLGSTPPNEGSNTLTNSSCAWYTNNSSSLQGLRIIVPDSYSAFNAYKDKFPEVADYIERES